MLQKVSSSVYIVHRYGINIISSTCYIEYVVLNIHNGFKVTYLPALESEHLMLK